MDIKKMPINQIKKANYNPRVELTPGDPAYEKLKNTVRRWQFN